MIITSQLPLSHRESCYLVVWTTTGVAGALCWGFCRSCLFPRSLAVSSSQNLRPPELIESAGYNGEKVDRKKIDQFLSCCSWFTFDFGLEVPDSPAFGLPYAVGGAVM